MKDNFEKSMSVVLSDMCFRLRALEIKQEPFSSYFLFRGEVFFFVVVKVGCLETPIIYKINGLNDRTVLQEHKEIQFAYTESLDNYVVKAFKHRNGTHLPEELKDYLIQHLYKIS